MIILLLASKCVSKHGFTFKVVNLSCLLKLILKASLITCK